MFYCLLTSVRVFFAVDSARKNLSSSRYKFFSLKANSLQLTRVFFHCTSVPVFFAVAIAKAKNVSSSRYKFFSLKANSLELVGFFHDTSVRVFFALAIAKAKNVSRTG